MAIEKNDKVISLADMARQDDAVDVTPTSTNTTELNTENIDLGVVNGADLVQAFQTGDLSKMEELGMSKEEVEKVRLQMQQYQKEAKFKQAYALLGEVYQHIMEYWPDEHILPDEEEANKGFIYDELNDHLLKTVMETMDEEMNRVYRLLAEKVRDIFIQERKEPMVKPEDRFENKFTKANLKIYDIEVPGVVYYEMNPTLSEPLAGQIIDEQFVAYKLLEFVVESVVYETAMLDDDTRKEFLNKLAFIPKVLDSIAVRKISNDVYNNIVNTFEDDIQKKYAKSVLNHMFPQK